MPATDLLRDAPAVERVTIESVAELDRRLSTATEPFVASGLVAKWPLVAAGRRSPRAARDYLLSRDRGRRFTASIGRVGGGERLFYDDAMGMNFVTQKERLPDVFARMDAVEGNDDAPMIYIASTEVGDFFDGLHQENHVPLGERAVMERIWIGTRSRIAAHNDVPHNLACVAVGRRRFTLFPPEQFANLYLGPLDNTPAGRAVSMVDFDAPDLTRFPRFAAAASVARVADLEAGDALFVPSLWWHHVEATEPFNVLVNYWWRESPAWVGQPQDALHHALMTIRDLPERERRHWHEMFAHFVFDFDPETVAHIPEPARGVLGPMTPETSARIRGYLLRQLNQ